MYKKLKAAYLRFTNPGYSCCKRCGTPWSHCKGRVVKPIKYSGQFSVCEDCWKESTLQELINYYSQTYVKNEKELERFGYIEEYTLEQLLDAVKRDKEGLNNKTINNIIENNA
jgi:hypothetical protein